MQNDMGMKIKVCGIAEAVNAARVANLAPDYIPPLRAIVSDFRLRWYVDCRRKLPVWVCL